MSAVVDVVLASETLQLHPQRALFWPRRRLLAIADLHLGKGHAFRRAGIALPRGGTSRDLLRLDALVAEFAPTTLLVLGDLLHGVVDPGAPWMQRWLAWREEHHALDVRVVLGNHDRAFNGAALRVVSEGQRCELAPFQFSHDAERSADLHAVGGHLHPVARLRGTGVDARLPVFWLGATRSVLPAFTRFSGGYDVHTEPGDRLWACADDCLVSLPAAAYAAGSTRSRT